MSIIRCVTRLCAVAALRDNTWAERRVFDSDNRPLAEVLALDAPPKPYMVIFTDADNRLGMDGRDIWAVDRNIALTLEIGVASAIEAENGGVAVRLPPTDDGMEMSIDITEGMALRALFDPENPWAALLARIILKIVRVPSQRGGRAERGSRWAARQCTLICDTIADVPPGVPLDQDHPINDFIELAKSEAGPAAGVASAGAILESVLRMRRPYPSWEQAQSWLGISKRALRGIGLGPAVEEDGTIVLVTEYGKDVLRTPPDREAPALTDIVLHDQNQGALVNAVTTDAGIPVLFPTVSVWSSSNNQPLGTPIWFYVDVAPPSGEVMPAGMVKLLIDGREVTSKPVASGGTEFVNGIKHGPLHDLIVGSHKVVALFITNDPDRFASRESPALIQIVT